MLLEQRGHIVAKLLATATWLVEIQNLVCLVFCLNVKLVLPSVFNSVNFWSGMFGIVLDIELADENFNQKVADFIDGDVSGYSFCPPKNVETH